MNDNYRLNISGDSRDLEQSLQTIIAMMDAIEERDLGKSVEGFGGKLREIAKLTKDIQEISSKNEGTSFVSAKDMNETITSTREATKLIQDFQKALQDVQNQRVSDGLAPDQEVLKTYEKLNNVLGTTKDKMDTMASTNIGKDGSVNALIKDMERLGTLTDDYYNSVNKATDAQERLSQVRATRNRVKRNLDKSELSGNMTYDQGTQTQQALNSVKTMKNDRDRFTEDISKTRGEFQGAKAQHKELAGQFSEGKIDKAKYEEERARIEATIKARDKELQTMEKLQKELDKTINYFEGSAQQEFGARTQDQQRGTFGRMMQERAPSIGSHAVMAGMAVGGGLYMQGKSQSEANRPFSVALGQQMGESDYGSVRQSFADDAIDNKLGLNSTDMLQLAEQYNASAGYTSEEDTRSATVELGTGMRSMGIANSDAYKESMSGLIKTGGADSALDIKDMQSAFIGGLKESGMVGRNEEQLKALTTIAEQNGQGRTVSNREMNNMAGIQTQLASSGSKGLQGEQGAQFLTGVDQGIKNGLNDPYTRLANGWGTEHQGLEGRYDLRQQLEKGISDPENITNLYDQATMGSETDKGQKELFISGLENMGVDATTEQSDELFKLAKEDKLTPEALKKYQDKMEKSGEKEKDKNSKDYKESDEGKNDQGKAKMDDLAQRLYDLAQPIRDVNNAFSGLPSLGYLLGASAIALTASFVKSMAMMKGAEMFGRGMKGAGQRGQRSRMSGRGNTPKGGGLAPGVGGSPKGGGTPGGGNTPKGSPEGKTGGGIKGTLAGLGFGLAGMFSLDTPDPGGNKPKGKGMPSFGGGLTDLGTFEQESKDKKGRFSGLKDKAKSVGSKGKETAKVLGDKSKGIFSKISDAGGQQPGGKGFVKDKAKGAGNFIKNAGKNMWEKAKDPSPYKNSITSGASKGGGLLKKVPYLGTGLMAGEGLMRIGQGENANDVGGSIASNFVDPFNLGYGDKIGKNLSDKGKEAEKKPLGIGMGKWEKGDRGLLGNAVTGAFDGVKSLFGGKEAKASEKKGGGGSGLTDALQDDSSPTSEGKEDSGKNIKGDSKKSPMRARMDAERLREKNNISETENLQVYRGLLDRFEQLIQEAKSLDVSGGSSEGDSDSGSDSGKSAGEITGTGSKKIWNFFKEKGLSESQIAGLMGNLEQESGLDPNAKNSSSGAFGIAQWLGSRKTGLDNFAKSKGKKNNDMDVQLDYLWKEMNTDYEKNNLKNAGWDKKADVKKNTSAFAFGFERMGREEANMGTREGNAKKYKEKYGGGGSGFATPQELPTPMETFGNGSSSNTSSENTTNHNNNVNINVTVEGGSNPEETGDVVGNAIATRISSLDIFTNQQKRK